MRSLTDHELRILRLVSLGQTHQEIADHLVMTRKGLTATVNRTIHKLGARNAPHAVHLAYQAGILRRERHGDHAGFIAHQRRGEDPWACDKGCPEGERTYRTERRKRQAANGEREAA